MADDNDFETKCFVRILVYIRLMDKILHDPKDPKLWELWYKWVMQDFVHQP